MDEELKCDETPIQVGQLNEDMAEIGRENENLTDEVDHHVKKMVELIEQLNERIPCDHCPKTFRTEDTLKEHINDEHVAWKWNDKSKKWDKTLKSKLESLPNPEPISDVKIAPKKNIVYINGRIPCDQCPTTFRNERNYRNHIQVVHVGLKNKKECSTCGKTFQSLYHLKRHQQSVHEGLRFHCNLCERHFSDNRRLKNHIRDDHGSEV